ncbi:MAG: GNAT family N-acetyltransferase [Chloroflexota bacterium]
MNIRLLDPERDWREWLRLRQALWPEETDAPHLAEMAELAANLDTQPVFVAERPFGSLGGFVEAGLRSYAAGCDTTPVPYIEGWYVDPDLRQQGVGRRLIDAVEEWARAQGYYEIASDAELHNTLSHQAHAALGFEEVERTVSFRKPLSNL